VTAEQVSPHEFREALARFAGVVTIVTAQDERDKPFSFFSLVLPPVLVCLERRANSFPVFDRTE
jgi:flavin reductase ActVB